MARVQTVTERFRNRAARVILPLHQNPGSPVSLNIVVGIATAGRPEILSQTLADLRRQSRIPDAVVVCAPSEADFGVAREVDPGAPARFLLGARGLTRQRNRIIDASPEADVMLFLDDDFLLDPGYVAAIEQAMTADPSIVVATGLVLADGINGPGLGFAEGLSVLSHPRRDRTAIEPVFSGYGCNMALRLAPMRAHRLAFDEVLPLYGWQEDVDLCRQLSPHGRIVQVDAAQGVHLGTKSGRNSGVRLGYSQIANPLYLARKKQGYPLGRALEHATRNMAANIARSLRPEPWVDRRGRLRGNVLALRDLLRGRMTPQQVLDL